MSADLRLRVSASRLGIDGAVGSLFAVFVLLLFLGYLYSTVPYGEFAPVPLAAAIGLLIWANLDQDRNSCVVPMTPPEPK